ncbi:MAG: threonine/serine dehydratase [Tepidibacter sp.]|jgi:threonine dehydratase|uniref:threonine ammonia-lyase n=1 Tax=Tepidibacter sp. TaxID=2529387 RepID=UPI0025EEF759|nr:threonine/serine dehydratase [Tepidibacter sp.]MCT4508276.1 threonine/serine dehydratase [Tepidibacter sp.]
MFSYEDIVNSRDRIKDKVYITPLEKSIYLSDENTNCYLKLESLQKSVRSFKIRGVMSKLTSLTDYQKEKGVVAVSSGNHAIALSYSCGIIGIKNSLVFVPKNTPKAKIDKINYFGASVKILGDTFDDAYEYAMNYINENDMVYIDAFSRDEVVYSGQGTIGIEIFEQNKNIDTILVPIGGGGLITGISVAAKHINPNVKIIGLQTKSCPAMVKALENNTFYETYPSEDSVCEALIGGVGEIAYKMGRECIDEIIEVDEEFIKKGTSHMIKKEKIIAEPSSAICVGAILQNPDIIKGKNAVLVISGGNIDEELMMNILNKY